MRSISHRHLAILLAVALQACGLAACGTINEKLAAGMGEATPQWAGGLPRDVPPRPGTPEYNEFMRERARKRLHPRRSGMTRTQRRRVGSSPASTTLAL
jgi:hypothetical protein